MLYLQPVNNLLANRGVSPSDKETIYCAVIFTHNKINWSQVFHILQTQDTFTSPLPPSPFQHPDKRYITADCIQISSVKPGEQIKEFKI